MQLTYWEKNENAIPVHSMVKGFMHPCTYGSYGLGKEEWEGGIEVGLSRRL